MSAVDARDAVAQAHREEWARVVASLAKRFGDLDLAEEAAAEAFATAVERWPASVIRTRRASLKTSGSSGDSVRLVALQPFAIASFSVDPWGSRTQWITSSCERLTSSSWVFP